MSSKSNKNKTFQGFDYPEENYFRMPNIWTDITSGMSSCAELKVVEYVLRHTWGFREFGKLKKITLDEFENGRRKADETRMDKGIGMRRQAIISGLRQAVKDGYLIEETDKTDKGRIKKFYGLQMLVKKSNNEEGEGKTVERYENHTPDVRKSYPRDMKITLPSEKETIERNYRKKPLNGNNIITVKSGIELLKMLKNLHEPKEKIEYIANTILETFGDKHSSDFYKLVASKIPESVIRAALSEIKSDGAKHPAKVFVHRMKEYAMAEARRGLVKGL
jgi:hypothetical protein